MTEQDKITLEYPNSRPLYYRHSGRFSATGVLLACIAGSAVGILGGAVYAYATLYIPLVYVCVLLTLGYGIAVGGVTANILHRTKTRNMTVAALAATAVATVSFAAMWIFWIYAFCARADANAGPDDKIDATLLGLILHPADTWDLVLAINRTGSFKLKNDTPTGLFLLAVWLVEAGVFFGFAVWYPLHRIGAVPFCEHCNKWGMTKALVQTATADNAALKSALERRDFSAIAQLRPINSPAEWYTVSLQGCADCDTTQTLCIDHVTRTVNKKGEQKLKNKSIVKRLRLDPTEVVAVAQAAAASQSPLPQSQS